MARKARRRYTPEQKADAVRMVSEVGNIAEVSRTLGIDKSTLRYWVLDAEGLTDAKRLKKPAPPSEESRPTETPDQELARLRRQVRQLEMERDFLKKAAAFFAREQGEPST
ncbi:MAG: transposase [Planctomycetota bacterium]